MNIRAGSRLLRIGLVIALVLAAGWADAIVNLKPIPAASAPCTVTFGMYETNAPWDSAMTHIRSLDTQINRHSAIVHWYGQWCDPGSGIFVNNHPRMTTVPNAYNSVGVTAPHPLTTSEA